MPTPLPEAARPFAAGDMPAFIAVFDRYYAEEFAIDLSAAETARIMVEVESGIREGYLHLLLATNSDSQIRGFILYQVDSPASDWCLREGSGFIRELYVLPDERGKGLGTRLVVAAEAQLTSLGVPDIYLTTDEATAFWSAQGYRDSGLICRRNGGRIFEKNLETTAQPRP